MIRDQPGLDNPSPSSSSTTSPTSCRSSAATASLRVLVSEQHRRVARDLDRLPATVSLTVGAAPVAVVGVPSAALAVRPAPCSTARRWARARRPSPRAGTASGLVALYLFADDIGKFPLFERAPAGAYWSRSPRTPRMFSSLILPWIVLGAASFAAIYARLVRANLLEVMQGGLHPHRAREKGLRGAARGRAPRPALGDHPGGQRRRGSTSATS